MDDAPFLERRSFLWIVMVMDLLRMMATATMMTQWFIPRRTKYVIRLTTIVMVFLMRSQYWARNGMLTLMETVV